MSKGMVISVVFYLIVIHLIAQGNSAIAANIFFGVIWSIYYFFNKFVTKSVMYVTIFMMYLTFLVLPLIKEGELSYDYGFQFSIFYYLTELSKISLIPIGVTFIVSYSVKWFKNRR